jgi:hypothetical protein
MIEVLDFERGFFILQNGMGYLRTLNQWEEAWSAFEEKHRRLAGFVAPTLDEIVRRDILVELRGTVTEAEHRFFLALLLNVPTRDDILGLVAQRFAGPSIDTIMRWAEELIIVSHSATWLLDVGFPEEIPIPVEERSEVFLAALRYCIEGPTAASSDALSWSSADLERWREGFAESSLKPLIL